MNLILVESPTKARTLTKFLGKDYRIEATFGHLRDLPKGELGVDVEHEFVPRYVIPRDKAKRVRELKALVSKTDKVILATDPDREGEAIAWHLTQIFKSSKSTTGTKSIKGRDKKTSYTSDTFDTFQRITFHEITQEAIEEALEMHELFHTANPSFTYFTEKTHELLTWLRPIAHRSDWPILTLDAGPNLHCLVPKAEVAQWKTRILATQPGLEIFEDQQGNGAEVVLS